MQAVNRGKDYFGNIDSGCLRQVGCVIEVTAHAGFTVLKFSVAGFTV